HLNAATYRFLELVAEFDREQAFARHGLINTAQWLNWQCGIGPVAAREKVRVARALEELPEIADAFAKGEISYSKVRAMTRVATPANESVLVHVARNGTAAHVEKLVRKYHWTQRRDAGKLAQLQHEQRRVTYFYDENGELILNARLPREIGAVVRKAIEAAVEALREPAENVSAETQVAAEQPTSAERPTAGARRADALHLIAEAFLAHSGEETGAGSSADRYQVVVHIDQVILCEEGGSTDDEPHRCELEDGPALALDTARRLSCNATIVGLVEDAEGEPLSIGRKSRSIPPSIARALRARDGGCRYPGCDRTRFTEGHHVKHWANGGETKLGNLVTLCDFHHRLVHEGGYGLAVTDDGLFAFTRPNGKRVEENGAQCFSGNISRLRPSYGGFEESLRIHMLNREANLKITADTGRCQWRGERMDYSQAIEGMQFLDQRADG
ncbi:MAG TPA: DUF222 domain-containing protein, partial [Terriglobales bacterium]|nr:DUF222 domain-containing protein [Terriglobales bacterium]